MRILSSSSLSSPPPPSPPPPPPPSSSSSLYVECSRALSIIVAFSTSLKQERKKSNVTDLVEYCIALLKCPWVPFSIHCRLCLLKISLLRGAVRARHVSGTFSFWFAFLWYLNRLRLMSNKCFVCRNDKQQRYHSFNGLSLLFRSLMFVVQRARLPLWLVKVNEKKCLV